LPARTSTSGRLLVDACDFPFSVNERPHEEDDVAAAGASEAAGTPDDDRATDVDDAEAGAPEAGAVEAA
jgi:hypothetical protein